MLSIGLDRSGGIIGVRWLREQIALGVRAFKRRQHLALLVRFDAFSYDLQL